MENYSASCEVCGHPRGDYQGESLRAAQQAYEAAHRAGKTPPCRTDERPVADPKDPSGRTVVPGRAPYWCSPGAVLTPRGKSKVKDGEA